MDKRCWMLIFSVLVSIPGIIGMACESKEHKAEEQAAFKALGGMDARESAPVTSVASFEEMVQNTQSPDMKGLAEQAKAKANAEYDANGLSSEAPIR